MTNKNRNLWKIVVTLLIMALTLSVMTVAVFANDAEQNNTAANGDYVAKVGDVDYTDLQAAIDAAKAGKTVTLLENIEIESNLANAGRGVFNLEADYDVTLDLNGKTITVTDNSAGNFIVIYNYGKLTVKNGTIQITSTIDRDWNAQSTVILNRGGELTIESGSYIHNGGTDMAITIDNSGNSFGDAYLYINGGEMKSTYTALRMRMANPNLNGEPGNGLVYLEMNDGSLYGGSRGIWCQITDASALDLGALDITGGTIEGGNQAINVNADSSANIDVNISGDVVVKGVVYGEANDIAITGGTFTTDVSDFVADGYQLNADGTVGEAKAALTGSGTEADPYIIGSVEALEFFRDSVNAGETTYNAPGVYVALGADIDLAGATWNAGIGDGTNASFDGIFDGKGYTIKNLTIDRTNDGYVCAALFGYLWNSAVIRDLTIENATINANGSTGNNVAVLAGFVYNKTSSALIENVTIKGDVKVDAINVYGAGAIVGYSYGFGHAVTIKGCTVDVNAGSYILADAGVGGIIGYAGAAVISDCTVKGITLTAEGLVGGIAGTTFDGASFKNSSVENVALNVTGANWVNSAAIVVGTHASNVAVDMSGISYSNVTDNGAATNRLLGSFYVEKPTTVVPAIVAQAGNKYYATLQDAVNAAVSGETITLLTDVESGTITVAGKNITLDLAGYSINGTCNANQASLIYIENNATLTVKDSAGNGKITFTRGTSGTGWTVDVKGVFILESGTIELAGASWSIGYAVDVRPNSWGSEYKNATQFVMYGGAIISTDGGVRVASSSASGHKYVSASFVMNGGLIDAAWDGVFVQQSDAIYDDLSVTINAGTIESDLNPIRVYGPAPTGYVNDKNCMDVTLNGGTFTYTGTAVQTWVIEGVIRVGGGSTIETILDNGAINVSAAVAESITAPEGYKWATAEDGTCYLAAVTLFPIQYTNVTLTENFRISFAFAADSVENWNGYYALITKTSAHDGSKQEIVVPVSQWSGDYIGTKYYAIVDFDGVAAKEMADVLSVVIYNADGVAVSEARVDSIMDYAMRSLNDSTDTKLSTLIVDMLNYGAQAQLFFGYATDKLANAELTDAQKALASSGRDYSADMYSKVYADGYNFLVGHTLVLEYNVQLLVGMDLTSLDLSDNAKIVVSYADKTGKIITKTESLKDVNYKTEIVYVTCDTLTASDRSTPVKFELIDGDDVIVTFTNSVESYAARLEANSDETDICSALMKYCDSAVAYFE